MHKHMQSQRINEHIAVVLWHNQITNASVPLSLEGHCTLGLDTMAIPGMMLVFYRHISSVEVLLRKTRTNMPGMATNHHTLTHDLECPGTLHLPTQCHLLRSVVCFFVAWEK